MRASSFLLSLLFVLFLPSIVYAVSSQGFSNSALLPGTQIVAGDRSKNEFYVVADRDVTAIKKVISSGPAQVANKQSSLATNVLIKRHNQVDLKKMMNQIRMALKDAANNMHDKGKGKDHPKKTIHAVIKTKNPQPHRTLITTKKRLCKSPMRSVCHKKLNIKKPLKSAVMNKRHQKKVVTRVRFTDKHQSVRQKVSNKRLTAQLKKHHKEIVADLGNAKPVCVYLK